MSTMRTRIAPSPTGFFHIGTARTALFSYAAAKQNEGEFVVRIEDTDKERSDEKYTTDILESLAWLKLPYDECYHQSQRVADHTTAIKTLVDADKAYVSKEVAKDGSEREVEVVRLRNPNRAITFTDLVRGDIHFDTTELGDFVIARAIDDPLYHLAVVVDDAKSNITHVIRGEDHISNTPRQILILEALGYERPTYAHLPLILASDKSKLSKRKHAASVTGFREQGFLPEALINYLALLGWTPEDGDVDIFTLEGFVDMFSLERVHKAGAMFDHEKLRWVNQQHLHKLNPSMLLDKTTEHLQEHVSGITPAQIEALQPLLRERLHTWKDIETLAGEGEFDFVVQEPTIDPKALPWKQSNLEEACEHLQHMLKLYGDVDEDDFLAETNLSTHVMLYAEEKGKGNVLWPLRYALTGKERSPGPFEVMSIIGKDASITRIQNAINVCESHTS